MPGGLERYAMERSRRWKSAACWAAASAAVLASGCSPGGGDGANSNPPFKPVASVEDLMHDVIYPNAEVVWDAVGTIITAEGTNEIRPRSHEEWEAVAQSALTVAEAGNLLMLEGRAKDAGEWMERAAALIDAAVLAVEAAHAHDPEVLFDVGGEVYYACNNCHESYWEKPPSAMRP